MEVGRDGMGVKSRNRGKWAGYGRLVGVGMETSGGRDGD